MKNLLFILITILLVSCGVRKKTQSSLEVSDIRETEKIYIDRVTVDTIRFETETLWVDVPRDVFITDTIVRYKNGRVSAMLESKGGQIVLHAQCDSLEKLVLSHERTITELRNNQSSEIFTEKKTVKSNFPRWLIPVIVIILILAVIVWVWWKFQPLSKLF